MPREPLGSRSCGSAYILTASGLLLAYSLTLAPGITSGDSGDLATAAIELGVPHPTGYPLFTMLAHLASRVPLPGDPVVRIEALNALLAVTAAMLLARTSRRLSLRLLESPPAWAVDFGALLAAASVAFTPVLWDQVRIPEVYALHATLVCWGLYELLRFEELRTPSSLYRVSLPIALGAAHHVTIVYLLAAAALHVALRSPGALVSWLLAPARALGSRLRSPPCEAAPAWHASWWVVWAGALTGALGLSLYAYSWWAAQHTGALAWGATVDLEHLVRHATGRQYRRLMAADNSELVLTRLLELPRWLSHQLLLPTLLAAALGLGVLARRSWRLALTLTLYAGLNLGHGLQYRVSDYANYYLPGVAVIGLLAGVGTVRGCVWLLSLRASSERGPGLVAAGLCGALGLTFAYYRVFEAQRLDSQFREGPWSAAIVPLLLLLGLGLAAHAVRGRGPRRSTLHLYLCLLALVGVSLPTWGLRLVARSDPNKASMRAYAEEVTRDVPPGALYLTGSDSYSFSLWYYQHVLGEGSDALLVNLHMLRRRWYLQYLRARSPRDCDLYGEGSCAGTDTDTASWFKVRSRRRRARSERPRRHPLEHTIFNEDLAACRDPAYREANAKACTCWDFNEVWRSWDEECVRAAELGGAVVRRSQREIDAHRLIADHIDERPVYERNVFTRWLGPKKNPRGWDGPAYHRLSARYALLNRGRINQVLYREDVSGRDACGAPELELATLPELSPPRAKPLRAGARPDYEPNPHPLLIRWSALQDSPRAHGHQARRRFAPGEAIWLTIWWFERWQYANELEEHQGPPIRHGVRICVFDQSGRRVHRSEALSTGELTQIELNPAAQVRGGTHTVQACSVGELGPAATEIPADQPCVQTILEYSFIVDASLRAM